MFRRFLSATLAVAFVLTFAIQPAGAATSISMVMSVGSSVTPLAKDLSSVAAMPNGRVVALTTSWNSASLSATRIDISGRSTTTFFTAGKIVGQNPSRFSWQVAPNGKLYVIYTTYALPNGVGTATAGVQIRSTSDGDNWSVATDLFPSYSAAASCTPATRLCGYIQPSLAISPNGLILATAVKTTNSTTLEVKSKVSVDGVSWTEPSNLANSIKVSTDSSYAEHLYSSRDFTQLVATNDGFMLMYPFVLPAVFPAISAGGGLAVAKLPYAATGAWETATKPLAVSAAQQSTAGEIIQGPFLAYSSGTLSALWFTRMSSKDVKLSITNLNSQTNEWSSLTQTQICNECTVSNDNLHQQSRLLVTPTRILLPFIVAPSTLTSATKLGLKLVTVEGGAAVSGGTLVADLSAAKAANLYGMFEPTKGSLSFVLRKDLEAVLVEYSGKTSKSTKFMTLTTSNIGLKFSLSADHSAGSSIHILSQEFKSGAESGTDFTYFRAVSQTKPTFVGVVVVSGSAKVGKSINLSRRIFTETSGTVKTSFQWFRCKDQSVRAVTTLPKGCSPVSKAVSNSYTLTSADLSKYILARITATNGTGSTVLVSDSTSKVVK